MADDDNADRVARFLAFIGGPENYLPKVPEPEPVEEGPVEDPEAELPPPVEIDPNFKPIYARDLIKNVQVKAVPAVTMSGDAHDFSFDSRGGQPAPLGICFCPFLAVTKYCYKFVPKKLMQPLATAFFDAEKIWSRDWDLYYVNSTYGGVVTFIPEHQLRALLDEINVAFPDAELAITDEDREGGLVLDFEDLPKELRPKWLGHCNSRTKHSAWVQHLETEPNMVIPDNGDRSIEAFKAKIEAAVAISKNKSKASKAKKLQENVAKRNGMMKEGLRSQRYLGLTLKKEDSLMPDISQLKISPVDTSKPPPYPFELEPIFISIDVEAHELPPRPVTEVGVATLDTRDLKGIAPGECGKDWFRFIRGRHFLISEHKKKINHLYVQGCPDRFEFGETEEVSQKSIASVLAACFREPFSKPSSDKPSSSSDRLHASASSLQPETRNIVIVGHDLGQDVNYCREIGYNIYNRGNIIDQADTANLYRHYTKSPDARSLGSILYDFNLSGWHLHNGGNDAVYTMQALLAIAVQSAAGRGEDDKKRANEALEKREETLVEGAKARAKEDAMGWDSCGEDGGVPPKPSGEQYQKPPKTFGPPRPQTGLYTMGGAPLDV